MIESLVLDKSTVPEEIRSYLYLINDASRYLPLMDLDDMRVRTRDLVEVKHDTGALNLTISYIPISWGRFRLSATMHLTFRQLDALGFSEKDIDDVDLSIRQFKTEILDERHLR